jgi:hypothetical protein
MTSPSSTPQPSPARPEAAGDAALFDAVTAEHGMIYGYGVVSAHSNPAANGLISSALREHRERREEAIARLSARGVTPPLPAPGYALPNAVDNPIDAAKLGLRMEEDACEVWRAVLEQASSGEDRTFAVTALTESAVNAAAWRTRLGMEPSTVPFPGGSD